MFNKNKQQNESDSLIHPESTESKAAGNNERPTKKQNIKKKRAFLGALVIIVAAAAILLLTLQPRQVETSQICGEDIIERHNAADLRGGSRDEEIKSIALEVESMEGYEQDPTCVFIVYYYYAYHDVDYDEIQRHLEIIKTLDEQDKHPDSDLIATETIERMESHLERLDPDYDYNKETEDAEAL